MPKTTHLNTMKSQREHATCECRSTNLLTEKINNNVNATIYNYTFASHFMCVSPFFL